MPLIAGDSQNAQNSQIFLIEVRNWFRVAGDVLGPQCVLLPSCK